jgi:hypothetical protein
MPKNLASVANVETQFAPAFALLFGLFQVVKHKKKDKTVG